MKRWIVTGMGIALCFSALAVERYVDLNNPVPVAPYTNWATAATDIQTAVNAASASDVIWVTNGVYNTGGAVTPGYAFTNRVCITNALTLCSVNGPEVTIIEGAGSLGSNAVRCVYLGGHATLTGFTLTKGCASYIGPNVSDPGGGVVLFTNAVVSNCVLVGNNGGGYGGGACLLGGSLNNCVLKENNARWGGGAYIFISGTLSNCTIYGNHASTLAGGVRMAVDFGSPALVAITDCIVSDNISDEAGGGVVGGTLTRCIVSNNWAGTNGGGVAYAVVNQCTISDNWSEGNGGGISGGSVFNSLITGNTSFRNAGGGLYEVNATNCTISGNNANVGGGIYNGVANSCLIIGNWAGINGGGAYTGTLNNCTVVANTAGNGGGMYLGEANNSIFYYNESAGPSNNLFGVIIAACCSPQVPHGVYGNITNTPTFADKNGGNYRLSSSSPCIDAGINGYALTTTDLDGNPRIFNSRVDMGAFEFHSALADSDNDGLSDAAEVRYGTNANNPDTDGDGFKDGWEVEHGWSPVSSDLSVLAYIETNRSVFGYYTEETVGDLAMGGMLVKVIGTNVSVKLQMMKSSNLITWTNTEQSVDWTIPAMGKEFFRVRAVQP